VVFSLFVDQRSGRRRLPAEVGVTEAGRELETVPEQTVGTDVADPDSRDEGGQAVVEPVSGASARTASNQCGPPTVP